MTPVAGFVVVVVVVVLEEEEGLGLEDENAVVRETRVERRAEFFGTGVCIIVSLLQ